MKRQGFLMLDLVVWLAIAPIVIILLLSFLNPTIKQSKDSQEASSNYRGVILLEQSILTDLMRGSDIESSNNLVINGAEYRVEDNELIRSYKNKEYSLGKGSFSVKYDGKEIVVNYNNQEFIYNAYWGDYRE